MFQMKRILLATLPLILLLLPGATYSISPPQSLRVPGDNEVIHRLNPGSEQPLDHRSIKLTVWNMFKGKKKSWEQDLHLLSTDSDILVLQEFFLNEKMLDAFHQLPHFDFLGATSFIVKRWGKETPTGVFTASTSSPIDYSFLRSIDLEPVIKTPKMLLFTTYPLTGPHPELLVVNIHGINFVKAGALQRQLEQAAERIEKFQGPVIFAGDFNAWSERKKAALDSVLSRIGMSEVTFHDDTRMLVFKRPVDFIFLRGIEVLSSQVYGNLEGSDHFALEAYLKVSK
jgi:endonuclease/exonuclease/phosphatase (EEP) superfamily protein YafD